MIALHFAKLEGLGNDFVIVDEMLLDKNILSQLAKRVCDRHLGIGADGLILYRKLSSPEAHFGMRLFNADGSEAEISGNGLRCLAACLFHQGLHDCAEVLIQTRAGVKRIRKLSSVAARFSFEVEMGVPILDPAEIPFRPAPAPESLVGYELRVGNALYSVTVTSMGNPHCSIFVSSFESLDWKGIGSRIETHASFPQRTNVEFVRVIGPGEIEVRFWERGVGSTWSSGTGACAAVVASFLNGYTERHVRVRTEGGELEIEWRADYSLMMAGPARLICEGECYIDDAY
jgi:diaminopimelate epimerase